MLGKNLNLSGFTLNPFHFVQTTISKRNRLISEKSNGGSFDKQLNASSGKQKMELERVGAYFETQKKQPSDAHVKNSLKQEIQELREQLQSEFIKRNALEKAIRFQPSPLKMEMENSIPKAAMELINQIAVLELEVVYLEKYLLSLYRRTYEHQVYYSSSTINETSESFSGPQILTEGENSVIHSDNIATPQNSIGHRLKERNVREWETEKLLNSSAHRSYSSLSQRLAYSSTSCSLSNSMAKAIDSYHSLPLSMLEQSLSAPSNSESLGEHSGALESPNSNWLSEEMLKSISALYCELAESPMVNPNNFSPNSSPLSVYELSSQDFGNSMRNDEKFSVFNSHFDNPFNVVNSEELSGPYSKMFKVRWISRKRKKDADINQKLQAFRSLVYRLKEVDLKEMNREEKLAFWINVHNTLIMHAYLHYGIPNNSLKRMALLLKASYNIGGLVISVDMIQTAILRCRLPRSGQWLRLFFPSKTKFKFDDAKKTFAISHPEPRLYFALCCGSHSDPAVRIYTPKSVYLELEVAKEEYILSNSSTQKGLKILLPKVVESFAKDSGFGLEDLMENVGNLNPDAQINDIHQCQRKRVWKSVGWLPHNFTFRFLLSKELSCPSLS